MAAIGPGWSTTAWVQAAWIADAWGGEEIQQSVSMDLNVLKLTMKRRPGHHIYKPRGRYTIGSSFDEIR